MQVLLLGLLILLLLALVGLVFLAILVVVVETQYLMPHHLRLPLDVLLLQAAAAVVVV
jgi:hypothetical protein